MCSCLLYRLLFNLQTAWAFVYIASREVLYLSYNHMQVAIWTTEYSCRIVADWYSYIKEIAFVYMTNVLKNNNTKNLWFILNLRSIKYNKPLPLHLILYLPFDTHWGLYFPYKLTNTVTHIANLPSSIYL